MQPSLSQLPAELLVVILEELPYEDLSRCKGVCRQMRETIERGVSLQYNMRLAVAGMEDNTLNTMTRAEKHPWLGQYQEAWDNLQSEGARYLQQTVHILDGPAWELAGGVIAQSVGPRSVEFRQLPSSIRDIPEKVWKIALDFDLRDFTVDPGQDLLVAVEPTEKQECRVRFMAMSTGEWHPKAAERFILVERPYTGSLRHEIRISGRIVGILLQRPARNRSWYHMLVWDWQSGTQLFVSSKPYWSFCFIEDRYILLADCISRDPNGTLTVVDLTTTSHQWNFQLPRCISGDTEIFTMDLLCEPGPAWQPPGSSSVPFYVSRAERLIVLMLGVGDDMAGEDHALSFSMLSSRLLKHMQHAEGETIIDVPWGVWGQRTCRVAVEHFWDDAWPCCVYGTRLISQNGEKVVIRDFNPYGVEKALSVRPESPSNGNAADQCIVANSNLTLRLFQDKVETALPYRQITTQLATEEMDCVMLSEDSIVIVKALPEVFQIVSL